MDVNLVCPVNMLSYGLCSVNILDSLAKLGARIALFPIGGANNIQAEPHHHASIREALQNAELPNFSAPTLRIFHQFDTTLRVGKGPCYQYTFFELDQFNEKEKHHLQSLDGVIVASHWAKEVVNRELPSVHCYVCPAAVDRSIFNSDRAKVHQEKTIFLNIGKWEIRKGHDVLVQAFNEAFNETDPVELWMMPHNFFISNEESERWMSYYKHPRNKIKILPRLESTKQVAEVMKQADCGVFPSRAEGFNLPLLEMMSCGKQVIATNYSAHTEFASSENCHLIPVAETEDAYDGVFFRGNQGNWAKLSDWSVDHLVARMRDVHRMKQEGKDMVNHAGIGTAKRFSWENTAKGILDIISVI